MGLPLMDKRKAPIGTGFEGKVKRLILTLNMRSLFAISAEMTALIYNFHKITRYQKSLEKFGDECNVLDFHSFRVDPLGKQLCRWIRLC